MLHKRPHLYNAQPAVHLQIPVSVSSVSHVMGSHQEKEKLRAPLSSLVCVNLSNGLAFSEAKKWEKGFLKEFCQSYCPSCMASRLLLASVPRVF